jgi:ABC-type uncharacterized transport system auxiliary subunit
MSMRWSLVVFAAGCGAVAVPEERSYRLPLPAVVEPAGARDPRVVRVEPVRLAAHLSSDHLMVADGPVLLRPYPLERWSGPLDGMVSDLVVACLRRTAAFAEVKAAAEAGAEDLILAGTLLDFHHDRGSGSAVVRIAVRLRSAADHRLLLADEVSAAVPTPDGDPAGAVLALAEAAGRVVAELARACSAAAAAPPR